jgi:limonene-1,2-epoxide hydrolase
MDADTTVRNFVKEWDTPAPDAARLATYFTEDAVYHNIPMDPIKGREAIQKALGGMSGAMQSAGWEIKHQVANGNVVMNERVDKFTMGGKALSIPVVGVFVLRDGKIAEWRDYFDMAMFQKQMA